MRSAFDFSPFRRSTVGFDRLFDMLENSAAAGNGENYPPFDLIKVDDNRYRIEIAVAGFKQGEIDMLSIELVREIPEAMKPRKIEIGGSVSPQPEPEQRTLEARAEERQTEQA